MPGFEPARGCSPATRPSRSAPRARGWCSATPSTPRRGCSRSPNPEPCSSTTSPVARPRRRSPTRTQASHEVKGRESGRARVDGAACRRRRGWRTATRRSRGAVRRPRARAAGDHPGLRRRALASARASRRGRRRGRLGKSRLLWEFFKYLDGIEEVRLLASGPVSLLRRGRGVLGACRDGARSRPDPRGGRTRRRP